MQQNGNIFEPAGTFDFTQLSLAQPIGVQGGSYFTKISHQNKPLYIEAPRCLTKQGFIKNGKKMFVELMFNNNDVEFIHWVENLESTCQKLIYEKGETWFQNKLETDDIESAFTSPLRVYKSGKYYLVRINVKTNYVTAAPQIKIYSENETPLSVDDVTIDTTIISIIEVQGIKFTSRSFQIEMELKQVMVLNADKIFDSCVIKSLGNKQPLIPIQTHSTEETVEYVDAKEDEETKEDVTEKETKEDVETKETNEGVSLSYLEKLSESILNNEFTTTTPPQPPPLDPILIPDKTSIDLEEFDINSTLNSLETITLKKPNQVYYEIYREAKEKAKKAKRDAIVAFLEAKNIKKTYMLDSDSDSDSDSDEEEDEEEEEYDISE